MATNSKFDVIHVDNAGAPFCQGGNDYACLQKMVGKFGVYVFQNKSTNDVLYVGQAHKQDLKTRIKQNYTENDTGGTFRNNFCEAEGKSFEEFKALLTDSNIKAISIETESKILIISIEAILIAVLKPKYNK